jgi:copper resistance protein B
MMFKRINTRAIGAITLCAAAACVAATWGLNAMAAEGTSKADDMSSMDHSKMDHSADGGMSMEGMQGGSAPADARDPHAYSGGYGFRPAPRLVMADEYYMSGLMINRLERVQALNNYYYNAYDLQGFVGKDYDKLVLKAEGEVDEGKIHEARTEMLWGHALDAYWNTQLGVRYDSGDAPSRSWLALGVQGLAPYWFEVDATVYVGEQGRTALRLSAEYELLITQKLILQPRIEASFYGMEDEARDRGAGLSTLVTGVRLRYEIRREIAPYVGVDWSGKYGGTADHAREAGARTNDTSVVAGLRIWY